MLNFGEGANGDIQTLVPVERTRVKQDEAPIAVARSGGTGKDGAVRRVQHHGTLLRGNGAGYEAFLPNVIGNNYVASESGGVLLDAEERLESKRVVLAAEFAGVEFRKDVVDIQNDRGAAQAGKQRGKDHEVRNGVDVQNVVAFLKVEARNLEQSAQKELSQTPEVGETMFFVDVAHLQAVDSYSLNDLFGRHTVAA